MRISLSEILTDMPDLANIPCNVIVENEKEVRQVWIERQKCKNCKGDIEKDCGFQTFDFYNGRIWPVIAICEMQRKKSEQQRLQKMLGATEVGKRFSNRRFETFAVTAENEDAHCKCLEYADGFPYQNGKGLLIVGSCGAGKTHLAVSILNRVIEKRTMGLFVTVPELLAEIRKNFNVDSKSDLIEKVKQIPFLILDDLGTERTTEWVLEQLFVIINSRYENMLPTIITTNCNMSELEEKIGQRIISRIIEMCDGIKMNCDDYRMRKLNETG